jgi:ATP-dependent exoDNAse (exonuclease V) alpha subunit
VRLIGDSRQLDAVESGGALRLLEREVGSVQLDTIHRFRNADGTVNRAEADASERLRDPATTGDPFTWYVDQGRVVGGDVDRMTGEVFAAWQADTNAGKRSVMLAQQNATVSDLNARAQAFRISEGAVTGREAADLRDGLRAHRGDTIVTRQNDSRLRTDRGRDRVKNNDLWTVDKVNRDGSLSVTHDGHGGRITLPADYVRDHVELGYASTVHRAQGLTADTSHVLADSSTSRSLAYVAMTRGKESNRLYVEVDDAQPVSDVLAQIANNSEGMMSANETIRAE